MNFTVEVTLVLAPPSTHTSYGSVLALHQSSSICLTSLVFGTPSAEPRCTLTPTAGARAGLHAGERMEARMHSLIKNTVQSDLTFQLLMHLGVKAFYTQTQTQNFSQKSSQAFYYVPLS